VPRGLWAGPYYHYESYSFTLRSAVDEAVEWRLLAESERSDDDDYTPFVYLPGPRLDEVREIAEPHDETPSWAKLARELNERSANDLEAISTIMFLERSGVRDAALKERFSDLEPHFASDFDARCADVEALRRAAGTE